MTKATNPNNHATSYAYDKLGQLLKETDPLGNSFSYAYDPNGNVKSRTDAMGRTTTTNYTYDVAERMLSAGSTDFAYNANGEMTSETSGTTTTRYTYDFEGALTKAGSETYERDPFGRTVSSTSGTTTTDYLFDGLEVIQEKLGANAAAYYTRGLGNQLISRRGGGDPLRYYHHDSVGERGGSHQCQRGPHRHLRLHRLWDGVGSQSYQHPTVPVPR